MRIIKNNAGDTIIEVLLALSVLGLVIGGGYSIATRSLNGIQISQERNEATKIAEGQLEALKAYLSQINSFEEVVKTNPANVINESVAVPFGPDSSFDALFGVADRIGFCFDDNNGEIVRFVNSPSTQPSGNKDDLGGYSNSSDYPGLDCRFGINDRYHVYIETSYSNYAAPSIGQKHVFTNFVHVTWERPGGNGLEHLYLNDRWQVGP